MTQQKLRNIAIIAHVDHGKTTLVDKLLAQSGTLERREMGSERLMDFNDQERERGITIVAKNTAIQWKDYRINIVDTPGHADFGGEVERILSMVDGVLLLVDAVDGPMPQTRFVTQKAFACGLHPIVVVNKIDRPSARPDWVIDQVFDLFDRLGANDEQLDFPIVYTSALHGTSGLDADSLSDNMVPLLTAMVKHVPAPQVNVDAPFQMQLSALAYDSYTGVIGIGRIRQGSAKQGQQVVVKSSDGSERSGRILSVKNYLGMQRVAVDKAEAGDIICVDGLDQLAIGDTLCDPQHINPLPPLVIDEPTVTMTFKVNDSPFAGKEGKFVTSRQIKERLEQELIHNVALRVQDGPTADQFIVSGRGELQLSVLIETLRREGFELGVSRPQVIQKTIDGQQQEPFEQLVIDCETEHQGAVMEALGKRGAILSNMEPDHSGRIRLSFTIPSRGLIGFRGLLMTLTAGSGLMSSVFEHYGPVKATISAARPNGVLVSMVAGKTLSYSLFNLQNRGRLLVGHGEAVYEGQIIGLHSRNNDLAVNPTKAKQLTNIRAAGTDEALILTPPIRHTLEQALDFIADDELVEVTPTAIRLRKQWLKENERKRSPKTA